MHRVFLAQPLEVELDDVLLEKIALADIDLVDWHRPDLFALGKIHIAVHGVSPELVWVDFTPDDPPGQGRP